LPRPPTATVQELGPVAALLPTWDTVHGRTEPGEIGLFFFFCFFPFPFLECEVHVDVEKEKKKLTSIKNRYSINYCSIQTSDENIKLL
jgi:hypothetical protein